MNNRFVHQRHKPPRTLSRPRELIIALPAMRSNVNVSRIVRAAGCCGVCRLIHCGTSKLDPRITRDALQQVRIERHRSLSPVLKQLKLEDHRLVALEQTPQSQSLYDFRFQRRTVLVLGHERLGLTPDILQLVDDVVEIPVYGLPHSHNAATAAAVAMYEYCRQFPDG